MLLKMWLNRLLAAICGITIGLSLNSIACAAPISPGMQYSLYISPYFSAKEHSEIFEAAIKWEFATGVDFKYASDCNTDNDYTICVYPGDKEELGDEKIGNTRKWEHTQSSIILLDFSRAAGGPISDGGVELALHEIGHALGLSHTIHGVMFWRNRGDISNLTAGDVDQFWNLRGQDLHEKNGDPIIDGQH